MTWISLVFLKLLRKSSIASKLSYILGLGRRRRRRLLKAFGSIEAIRAAWVDELAAVPDVMRSIDEQIKLSLQSALFLDEG